MRWLIVPVLTFQVMHLPVHLYGHRVAYTIYYYVLFCSVQKTLKFFIFFIVSSEHKQALEVCQTHTAVTNGFMKKTITDGILKQHTAAYTS